MDFCTSIKVHLPLFISFPEDDTLPFLKIDFGNIHFNQFHDQHTYEARISIIAKSRISVQLSLRISRHSSLIVSLRSVYVRILSILHTGLSII